MKWRTTSLLALSAVVFPVSTIVTADVYRYIDEQGVTCFTDSPTQRDAVRIATENNKNKAGSRSRSVPLHLTGSGIANKLGTVREDAVSLLSPPTPPLAGRITSLTGLRHDPIDGKLRHHNGIDIAVPTGTPVKAVSPATVIFSGIRPGYGNVIILGHSDGTVTVYAHNSTNLLSEGAAVDQGTIVALSGSTGRSTGPHLHFEAWRDGNNITSSYFPGLYLPENSPEIHEDEIYRITGSDGSIVFTNMR